MRVKHTALHAMVDAKLSQWHIEALLASANHGRNHGAFKSELWANGKTMITPIVPWATIAHAIPQADFEALKANNWNIYF